MTRVTCCQLSPRVGDLDGNRRLALDAVTAAVAGGADIVVLPELVTSGYVFASRDEAASLALDASDPLFREWAAAAGPASLVVGGFAERGAGGTLYNSVAVVAQDGVRAVYRKLHLWDREKLFFAPGDDLPPLVDTDAGRVGVLICYDLEFPEMTRHLALAGADLVLAPTNWPAVPKPEGEHPPEVTIAMAAARVNHVAIACCDRAGVERGQHWTEGSAVIDQDGWVVATPDGSGTASADLDLARSRDKSYTPLADAFADRRPDLYARLLTHPATDVPGSP